MLRYIKGDIIDFFKTGEYECLMHQANCVGAFGAGVAFHLAREFPDLLKVDSDKDQETKYGSYSELKTKYGNIVNIYGQVYPGRCAINVASPDHFLRRITALVKGITSYIEDHPSCESFLIPLMASGLASDMRMKEGKTDLEYFQANIEPRLRRVFATKMVVIVEYDPLYKSRTD
jgi:hypothetical protein